MITQELDRFITERIKRLLAQSKKQNGVSISGSTFSDGAITGATSIDTSESVSIGKFLTIDNVYGAGVTWANGHNSITIDDYNYAMYLEADYLYWGSDLIATRPWVSGNFASYSHSHSYATSSDISSAIGAHVTAYHI